MHQNHWKISGIFGVNSINAGVKTWPKKTSIFLLVPILILSMATTLGVASSMDSETARVYVDPPLLTDYRLVPGTLFNISVNVDNIPADPGLAGAQFQFFYDPALLSATVLEDVMFHNVTPQSEWDNIWALQNEIDNAGGCVTYTYAWQDNSRASEGGYCPISGNHTMAIIEFEVMGTGGCVLSFDRSSATGVILGDPSAQLIPCEVSDGYFNNVPPLLPELTFHVDPPKVKNNSLGIGSVFYVSVEMDSNIPHQGVVGLQFNLTWNPTVLEAVNMTEVMFHEITPQNEYENIWEIMQRINNTGGYLVYAYAFMDVKTAVSHGYAPITGNHTLASIAFRIKGTGTSGLNLTACKAGDARGAALGCATVDGVFEGSNLFPADLNSDGTVNISDAIIASNSYGSSPGDPRWNPAADLDGNGIVDILDMIRLAAAFGRIR